MFIFKHINSLPLYHEQYYIFAKVLKGAEKIEGRPGASLPPLNFEDIKETLSEKYGTHITEEDVMSAALYPKVSLPALTQVHFIQFRANLLNQPVSAVNLIKKK